MERLSDRIAKLERSGQATLIERELRGILTQALHMEARLGFGPERTWSINADRGSKTQALPLAMTLIEESE